MARNNIYGRVASLVVGSLDVSNLRFKFNVKRSRRQSPNSASISVYNLSRDHINEIRQVDVGVRVALLAGYKPPIGTSVIFSGELRNANIERDGPDLVLTLEAGDGDRAIRGVRFNKSFAPGTRVSDVITQLAKSTGVGLGNLASLLDTTERVRGISLTVNGPPLNSLDGLLRARGISFSIQDGVIQASKGKAPIDRTAILVNSDTGMIGSPSRGADGIVNVKMPILPEVVPGRVIQVDAEFLKGNFVIESTSTNGDTDAGDWTIDIEGKPYKV